MNIFNNKFDGGYSPEPLGQIAIGSVTDQGAPSSYQQNFAITINSNTFKNYSSLLPPINLQSATGVSLNSNTVIPLSGGPSQDLLPGVTLQGINSTGIILDSFDLGAGVLSLPPGLFVATAEGYDFAYYTGGPTGNGYCSFPTQTYFQSNCKIPISQYNSAPRVKYLPLNMPNGGPCKCGN